MKFVLHIALIGSLIGLTACSKPPPPRSVSEFMDNPILLEAALVRCTQDREKSRYDAECMNAREVVRIGEAEFAKRRRADLEAESLRKREALRRTQWAAAEARRRAADAGRRRDEAEYLAQFGELPPADTAADEVMSGNAPMALIPNAEAQDSVSVDAALALSSTGSNAPLAAIEPEPESEPPKPESLSPELESPPPELESPPPELESPPPEPATTEAVSDLEAVREELRRRDDDGVDQ